jgi:hypothetical protein
VVGVRPSIFSKTSLYKSFVSNGDVNIFLTEVLNGEVNDFFTKLTLKPGISNYMPSFVHYLTCSGTLFSGAQSYAMIKNMVWSELNH